MRMLRKLRLILIGKTPKRWGELGLNFFFQTQ